MTYRHYPREEAREHVLDKRREVVALSKYDLATCNQEGIRCDERGSIWRSSEKGFHNMAIIYRPDGTRQPVQPANGRCFELGELQRIVGEGTPTGRGYIEIVPCKDKKHILVLNEEGKLLGLPINVSASELAALPTQADLDRLRAALGDTLIVVEDDDPLDGPDVIVGTALMCAYDEVE